MNLGTLFLLFVVYCFIGWFYESIVLSIQNKKIINTGFLTLPLCPIYGFGALLCVSALQDQLDTDVWILFLSCAVICCTLEYIVSWLLEKIFKARWWDYTNYKFNINGRVCLLGAFAFGLLCVCLLKYIHPFVFFWVSKIPTTLSYILSIIIFTLIMVDLVNTLKTIAELTQKLNAIQKIIDMEKEKSKQKLDSILSSIHDKVGDVKGKLDGYSVEIKAVKSPIKPELSEKIKAIIGKRRFSEKRIIRAFPTFRPFKNVDAFERLKAYKNSKTKK